MIHHTVGVYPDGSMKHNGVPSEALEAHIEYNLLMRPGRALIVDGLVKNRGSLSQPQLDAALIIIMASDRPRYDTAPYV